jgi:imidazolonepropionase-like amidohydrolase
VIAPLLISAAILCAPAVAPHGDTVAVQAGTIHLVENGTVITDGGTILIVDGRITAAGSDVVVPPGVRIVDYGSDAVIVPGFVAADSNLGSTVGAGRAAEPGLVAVDNFDPFASFHSTVATGVTSAYVAPARRRIIAGQGGVVKLAGEGGTDRILSARSAIHGAITAEARSTPGYWEPPIPATVDQGMGVELRQLPRTTMGAIVALEELLSLARGEGDAAALSQWGPDAGPGLAELMEAGVPFRMAGRTVGEIRALADFFSAANLPLILDEAVAAGDLASRLAAAGASVIVDVPLVVNRGGLDRGTTPDTLWPRADTASRLAAAGVPFALVTPDNSSANNLRLAACVARRGGLSAADALRAITLSAAEILDVDDRVGSIAPGKDGDLVVLNDPVTELTTSVLEVWIDGNVAWKAHETSAVVLEVDELHIGDGEVMSPGQILMEGGRIIEVGRHVSHPAGATVVRGAAAMPGMVDASGRLGLERSSKSASPETELARIVEPADDADRRVARAGVTTIALTPRGTSSSGTPIMAYKPGGTDVETMVLTDPSALSFIWTARNRSTSGNSVRKALEKARAYVERWEKYEEEMAQWSPPAPEPEEEDDDGGDDDEDNDEDEDEEEEEEVEDEVWPLTGMWKGGLDGDEESLETLRIRLNEDGEELSGTMRCSTLADELIELHGKRDEEDLKLSGAGLSGPVSIEAEVKKGRLEVELTAGEFTMEFVLDQVSTDAPVVRRPERRKTVKAKDPKGMPKNPGIDRNLEPLRQAMKGQRAILVSVDREDEILECVETFEAYGIRPVLTSARDVLKVADRISGRVAGVLLGTAVTTTRSKTGTEITNRYAALQAAGIPVAFASYAEVGALELPEMAIYAVSMGMSPTGALRALTSDAAKMLTIDDRVGRLAPGLDGDVLLLDAPPLGGGTTVLRVWINGREVR